MKINLKENALKTTIFGNIFSLIGLGFLCWYGFILIYVSSRMGSFDGDAFAFLLIFSVFIQLKISLVGFILAIVECFVFRNFVSKYLKYSSENKFYSVIFYVGFVFNFIIWFFSVIIYLGTISEQALLKEYFSL